jgi:hypothetical protein
MMPTKLDLADTTSHQKASTSTEPPAMGERRARWGYGYQDKVATAQILDMLRADVREGTSHFEGVRLADLQAGRVDDFVLIFDTSVQGNSIKWNGASEPMNWGDLIGADGLLLELAEGCRRLSEAHSKKGVSVQLQTNRPAATSKHPSQLIHEYSVAEFLGTHWQTGPSANDSETLAAAWTKIREHTRLDEAAFAQFVACSRLRFAFQQPPYGGPDSQDQRTYLKQFDELHKALATWLTNHPDSEFIDRHFLLTAIGFSSYRSGLEQHFPAPEIPYARNAVSAARIKEAIDSVSGGYLAVTGPAGIGKSTLVQDVLSEYPFFVPYYAYLPDGIGNPRDRGEALTFFQDVVTRLDRFFDGRKSLGVADVTQGREALRLHMQKAKQLFEKDGHKTILLIDGLDHVQREPGLDHPLLLQLPTPAEVPDGFVIILSSQPQALLANVIERHVSAAVSPSSERRIQVEGLSRDEVHAIALQARSALTFEDKDAIFEASSGNPLILTYLLRYIELNPDISVDLAIANTASYSGDIDVYYHSALSVSLLQSDVRTFLTLLSRTVAPIPINWINSWPERTVFETLFQTTLGPFVRTEGGRLYFIHNSLVAFLKSETRSKVPDANLDEDERRYHSILAERCGDAACSDPVGRAKVFHLLRSERYQELLDLLSTTWLRKGVESLLPLAEIRPLVLHGISAAWKMNNFGEVLRLILLDFELAERANRMAAKELARELLALDRPELAVAQIRSAGRILVDDKDALESSADLHRYAVDHNAPALVKQARIIYLQTKPINFIYRSEPIDRPESHQAIESLQEWAEIAPLFESPDNICNQIMLLRFAEPKDEWQEKPEVLQAVLLYKAVVVALDEGASISECLPFLVSLARFKVEPIYFAALLRACSYYPSPLYLRKLRRHHARLAAHTDIDLQFAELLLRLGDSENAREVCSTLAHARIDGYQSQRSFGLTDISYTIRLRRLQVLLGLDSGLLPEITDDDSEAVGRIEAAARSLGEIVARVQMNETLTDLRGTFRSLILFHNRPQRFERYNVRSNYRVAQSKTGIYRRITDLAALIGPPGIQALKDEFTDIVNGPASRQFTSVHRRLFALFFFQNDVMDRTSAVQLGLSNSVEIDDDPAERQRACLENAVFMKSLGDEATSNDWVLRAGLVTAGAGNHKDYHMAQLADWLTISCGASLDTRKIRILDKFIRSLEVAGGDGAGRATSHVLRFLAGAGPDRASTLVIELVDREMLNVEDALESLLLGAIAAGASLPLARAVYCELHTLICTGHTSEVAIAIVRRVPASARVAVSRELLTAARTNSLPSYRLGLARALQDVLLEDGAEIEDCDVGLRPDHDDSSMEGSLYKLTEGRTLSTKQVALRLSDPSRQDSWNPNPSANEKFSWWDAIKRADIKNVAHAENLLAAFAVPDYKDVEVLAWKSKISLDAGDRAAARQFAEQALAAADDGSWFTWMDGAKQRVAYAALMQFDETTTLNAARERFGNDLTSGKLWNRMLLDDAPELFGFLKIEWPDGAVLDIIENYLDNVLSVSRTVQPVRALTVGSSPITPDAALMRFVIHLLAFPAVDVGVAARRALGRFLRSDPDPSVPLISELDCCDSVQVEHFLSSIHVGLISGRSGQGTQFLQVKELYNHPSAGVRAIARRICAAQEWPWSEVNDQPFQTSIVLPDSDAAENDEKRLLDSQQVRVAISQLSGRVIRVLSRSRDDDEIVRSELLQQYWKIEKVYSWVDGSRLSLWMKGLKARFWLNTRAIIAREAAMRVLGIRALSGLAPAGTETSYNLIYPIYDPRLELTSPVERPVELRAMEWSFPDNSRKSWLAGEDAGEWACYPSKIAGMHIIGERTYLIRPDWEWPREERYRGILASMSEADEERDRISSHCELTYECYLEGVGQDEEQIIVANNEQQLVGPAYRWIAFSSTAARSMGWVPTDANPFEWRTPAGQLMVKSVYWRDGWIGLEPPHMEPLGEGWFVVATPDAISTILRSYPDSYVHLWVERHSYGDAPYHQSWHLVSTVGFYE